MDKKSYEDKFGKQTGADPTRGSGAVHDDADFRIGEYLIEHKYRDKKTVWAPLDWWSKVKKQAILRNREPLLVFENPDCSVVYFMDSAIDLDSGKYIIQYINSSRSVWLRNKKYLSAVFDVQDTGKIFLVHYVPEKLNIMHLDDFQGFL